MASHTKEQREFLVRRLAAFETPREAAIAFAQRFTDTACSEYDVLATDPLKAAVAPELYALFLSERDRVLVDPSLAPYTNQAARMIVYSRQVDYYKNNNQPVDACRVLRYIAEELGAIGPKGGAVKATDKPREITEIIETIIDPAATAATAEPETVPA